MSNKPRGSATTPVQGTYGARKRLEGSREICSRGSRFRLLGVGQGAGWCLHTAQHPPPASAHTSIRSMATYRAPAVCAQEGSTKNRAPSFLQLTLSWEKMCIRKLHQFSHAHATGIGERRGARHVLTEKVTFKLRP